MSESLERLGRERQVTKGPGGRILANAGVWSPDGDRIVYDTRSDAEGKVFDGRRIEMVDVKSGEVRILFESDRGTFCGVPAFHPREWKVVFIRGPEEPTPDWSYNAFHREGMVVRGEAPGRAIHLEARDLVSPYTPGALRGGTHVHLWEQSGEWVSFTYEDHVLAQLKDWAEGHDVNQRNVGVCFPTAVAVGAGHPRNHNGHYFSVLVTRTVARPKPSSDEIGRASEEAWVGTQGYMRTDGVRQRRALAFQGEVVLDDGRKLGEVFVVDLPEDLTVPGEGPLAGTTTRHPSPPKGCLQRRLTFTAARKFPGLAGPRHWLRSSPDGSQIAFLMTDDEGIAQVWTVSPCGGAPRQLTRNPWPIGSTYTWSPDGRWIAHVMDQSVCVTEAETGQTHRVTERRGVEDGPRAESCVFSPDGERIAFVRRLGSGRSEVNQICVVTVGG